MAAIAFLGLGNMGGPMAKNLLAAGHDLTVFDLVEAACVALAAEGASVAASASDVCLGAYVLPNFDSMWRLVTYGKTHLKFWEISKVAPTNVPKVKRASFLSGYSFRRNRRSGVNNRKSVIS